MLIRVATGLAVALVLPIAMSRAEPTTLLLTTQHWPPYHELKNGTPHGIAITALDCILDRMKQPRRIEFLPWRRAQDEVRAGRAHGFLLASHSPERDRFARLSAPIAPQTWAWYLPHGSTLSPTREEFKSSARTSALAGSNMAQWLTDSGYKVGGFAATTDQLVLMLQRGRVDAVLANTLVFDYSVAQLQIPATQFRRAGEVRRPLGVYFSRRFLAENPTFLNRFNAEVARCRAANGAT
ncbi:MAG: substrate-binding periplasmic protein [Alphaproteobacteria bacterium]